MRYQLALTTSDKKVRYIVSDESWQAAEKKDAERWVAAHKVGKLGDAPWRDVFAQAAARRLGRGLEGADPGGVPDAVAPVVHPRLKSRHPVERVERRDKAGEQERPGRSDVDERDREPPEPHRRRPQPDQQDDCDADD